MMMATTTTTNTEENQSRDAYGFAISKENKQPKDWKEVLRKEEEVSRTEVEKGGLQKIGLQLIGLARHELCTLVAEISYVYSWPYYSFLSTAVIALSLLSISCPVFGSLWLHSMHYSDESRGRTRGKLRTKRSFGDAYHA